MNGARSVWLTLVLLLAAAVIACACLLPLIWDGAYQLAASLVEQKPYFHQARFHSWPLWWPCIALSRVTDNLTALTFAFGLPFIAAPALSLWLSWRVVRRHRPELIKWAAFGVAAAGLPGQAFVIDDSIWQQTMFWPVFLGVLVPVSRRGKTVLGLLALLQLSHPVGALLLLIAAVASLTTDASEPRDIHAQLGKFVPLAMLFLIAAAKSLWSVVPSLSGKLHDSYGAAQLSLDVLASTFSDGVVGLPLCGIVAMWLAALATLMRPRVLWPSVAAILVAGLLWSWWAAEPQRWAGAINCGRWVVPLALPFMLAAFLSARPSAEDSAAFVGNVTVIKPEMRVSFSIMPPRPRTEHRVLLPVLGLVFCTVITLQSLGWWKLVKQMDEHLARDPRSAVPRASESWMTGTPIDHWGTPALVALRGGRQPQKYFVFNASAEAALRAGKIWLGEGPLFSAAPGPAGWFDHRPLLERLAAEAGKAR